HQAGDDDVRVLGVAHEVQDPDQHDGDRLGEVERLGGSLQDRPRVPQIAVDVGRPALRPAGQQLVGVGEDDGVVVNIDDAGFGRGPLGHLVDLVAGRDAGADVEVLPDAGLGGQIAHGLTEEIPVGPHDAPGDIDAADRRCRVDSSLAIHVEVDATAQQVVVHTRRVSNARVDD